MLSLIAVSLRCGRRGLRAGFFLGRSLNKRRRPARGFKHGKTPCHATLAETLRAIDGRALADVLGAVRLVEGGDQRHIAIVLRLLSTFADCPEKGHGRIEQRSIEVLPAKAAGIEKEWWAVESICRVARFKPGHEKWRMERP